MIYGLSDLHLSPNDDKPMDIFGRGWQGHPQILFTRWNEVVSENDLVLVPGDITWSVNLKKATKDLRRISKSLNGYKLLVKGNHDWWWKNTSWLRKRLPPDIMVIDKDCLEWEGYVICGATGWLSPNNPSFETSDLAMYEQEIQKLKSSLRSAPKSKPIIAALHYPPWSLYKEPSVFTNLLKEYKVKICIYGHLHGKDHCHAYNGVYDGIEYRFVAADYLGFYPLLLSGLENIKRVDKSEDFML